MQVGDLPTWPSSSASSWVCLQPDSMSTRVLRDDDSVPSRHCHYHIEQSERAEEQQQQQQQHVDSVDDDNADGNDTNDVDAEVVSTSEPMVSLMTTMDPRGDDEGKSSNSDGDTAADDAAAAAEDSNANDRDAQELLYMRELQSRLDAESRQRQRELRNVEASRLTRQLLQHEAATAASSAQTTPYYTTTMTPPAPSTPPTAGYGGGVTVTLATMLLRACTSVERALVSYIHSSSAAQAPPQPYYNDNNGNHYAVALAAAPAPRPPLPLPRHCDCLGASGGFHRSTCPCAPVVTQTTTTTPAP